MKQENFKDCIFEKNNKIFKKYKKVKQKDGTYKIKHYKGESVVLEDVLHKECVNMFHFHFGDWRENNKAPMLVHIANQTPRSSNVIQMLAYNRKMKAMGKITGIPDFVVYKKTNELNKNALFIELKSIDNKLDENQIKIHSYLVEDVKVCCSVEEFLNEVRKFLLIEELPF